MSSKKKFGAVVAVAVSVVMAVSLFCVPVAFGSTASSLKTQCTKIVSANAGKGTNKDKLVKLAKYVEGKYGYANYYEMEKAASPSSIKNAKAQSLALNAIKNKKGNCIHFAVAYGFLAKKATGYTVRVAIGKAKMPGQSSSQNHAWTEVKISGKWYVYDTNGDKFYAGTQGSYSGSLIGISRTGAKAKGIYTFSSAKYVTLSF